MDDVAQQDNSKNKCYASVFRYIYIILKEIIMIIQTYHKDTLDITQIVDRHIQIHSHIVF